MLADHFKNVGEAHQAAGEENRIDLAAQHCRHLANLLADLIDHRAPDEGGLGVTGLHLGVDDIGIRRAEEADEPSGARTHEAHVLRGMAGVDVVEQRQHGNAPYARRGEGALAIGPHVAIDHAAAAVGADGDAAVDVRDDEVAVLIAAAQLLGVEGGDGLLVEDVRVRDAIDAAYAGEARLVLVFIDVGRVEGVCLAVEFLSQRPCEHDAKLGGMLATADRRHGVVV